MNIGCKDTYFFLNILRFRGIFVLNNKKAAYNIYSFNKSMLQTAMKTVCTDGYELVDSDDLEMVVEIIQAALNDSK